MTTKYYISNIEKLANENENYRKVIFTTTEQQYVIMSLKPKEDIGKEIHSDVTQMIKVVDGNCTVILNGKTMSLEKNDTIVIQSGVEHNIINSSNDKKLKLFTIYSPPEHASDLIQVTKPIEHKTLPMTTIYTNQNNQETKQINTSKKVVMNKQQNPNNYVKLKLSSMNNANKVVYQHNPILGVPIREYYSPRIPAKLPTTFEQNDDETPWAYTDENAHGGYKSPKTKYEQAKRDYQFLQGKK